MFGFGRQERDLSAELESSRQTEAAASLPETDGEVRPPIFGDAEYEAIFKTLTPEDLRSMSASELARLSALTFAAAEDDVDRLSDDYLLPEIAADYARASALGNLALLKQAGIEF